MSHRINRETKAQIKSVYDRATGTFAERAGVAFASVGMTLAPSKAYPSCYPWLGAPKKYHHATASGRPAKPQRPTTDQPEIKPPPTGRLTIAEAADILAQSIAELLMPVIEDKVALALATSSPSLASRPTVEATKPVAAAVKSLSTRDKLIAELKAAKEAGNRFAVIRCVDKLRQLQNKDAKLERELDDDGQ